MARPHDIVVGMTASLTGRYRAQGNQALAGVQAWVEDTNRAGGLALPADVDRRAVRLLVYDDAGQADRCGALIERLITADQVHLLLGPYASGLARRAAAVAEQHQQVLWNHGGSSDTIYTSGYKWVVGILTPASRYFHGLIDFIRATYPSVQNIAIVYAASGAFPREVATGAARYGRERGFVSIDTYPYEPGTVDFAPLLQHLSRLQTHLLLGVGRIEDDLRLAAQLVRSTFRFDAVGLIATPLQRFHRVLGSGANGFLGPSQWEPVSLAAPDYGPSLPDVMRSFGRHADHDVDYPMAQAYAGCLVAQRCLELAGSLAPHALRQAAGQLDFTTFYGRFHIDPMTGCQLGHTMPIVQWHDSAKTVVWPPDMRHGLD